MKKIASALLAALLVIASLPAVLAAESPSLTVTENNINAASITLKLTAGGDNVGKATTLRVYKEGVQETIANMRWADEKAIGTDGNCSFTVDVGNYDTGKYVFVSAVSGLSAALRTEAIQIYGNQEKIDLLNRVLTAKEEGNASEVEWVAENRWEYLSLNKEGFDAVVNTETVSYRDIFCGNVLKAEFTTLDGFRDAFNKTVSLTKLYQTTDAKADTDMVLEAFELNKEDNAVYAAYAETNKEARALAIATALAKDWKALTADNFEEKFNSAVVLELLSEQLNAWSGYASVLKNYATVIGIDMSDYNDLTNQSTVINGMIANHKNYSDLKDVASDFETKVADQKSGEGSTESKPSSKPSRPSTGGGGGGFSGGVKDPAPTEPSGTETEPKSNFSDMASCTWAVEAVNYLSEKGIIKGRDDGSFDPNGNITRAEAVKILVEAFGLTEVGEEINFTDVGADKWYYDYIRIAFAAGIVSGISESEFAPEANVSRQDMAVLLNRAMKLENAEQALDFADSASIADYAAQAVANLVKLGVISGTDEGNFEPTRHTTRAQAAKMFYEILTMEVR